MTVAELIAELKECHPDSIVILQKDSEGNGYSPLSGLDDLAVYVADNDYRGEVRTQNDIIKGYGIGGVPCVVLYPAN